MNYNDDYESVTTMAHEWGHAMHSYLANRAQPFVTSNSTFIAESLDVQRRSAAS
jgi:oligoendopeptidase F